MQVAVTSPVLSHLSDSCSDSCASFDNIMHSKCGHLWSFREPLRRRLIYQSELFLTSFRLSAKPVLANGADASIYYDSGGVGRNGAQPGTCARAAGQASFVERILSGDPTD